VLVSTQPGAVAGEDDRYVHVDWVPDFALHHTKNLSEEIPALFIDLGPLALNYILSTGGSGYFRMSAVKPHVSSGRLHLVAGAPEFSYPIYVVYTGAVDDPILGPALSGLRKLIPERNASQRPAKRRAPTEAATSTRRARTARSATRRR
jgi:hypothetical protein